MQSLQNGRWFSLFATEPIKNLSLCVQENDMVRNIKSFEDYNSHLVIVCSCTPDEEDFNTYINQAHTWVRCLAVTANPSMKF